MAAPDHAQVRVRRLLRDLAEDRRAMATHASEIERLLPRSGDSGEAAQLAVALHHYYTAFEGALQRLLLHFDGELPAGPDWHRGLLREAARSIEEVRPSLISPIVAQEYAELLRFRHFFRHAYAVTLDWQRLGALGRDVASTHGMATADLDAIARLLAAVLAG